MAACCQPTGVWACVGGKLRGGVTAAIPLSTEICFAVRLACYLHMQSNADARLQHIERGFVENANHYAWKKLPSGLHSAAIV